MWTTERDEDEEEVDSIRYRFKELSKQVSQPFKWLTSPLPKSRFFTA